MDNETYEEWRAFSAALFADPERKEVRTSTGLVLRSEGSSPQYRPHRNGLPQRIAGGLTGPLNSIVITRAV